MELDLLKLMDFGTTAVIMVYFIYRDMKFMQKLNSTLDVIMKLIEEKKED